MSAYIPHTYNSSFFLRCVAVWGGGGGVQTLGWDNEQVLGHARRFLCGDVLTFLRIWLVCRLFYLFLKLIDPPLPLFPTNLVISSILC
jgi:hypothetical protein